MVATDGIRRTSFLCFLTGPLSTRRSPHVLGRPPSLPAPPSPLPPQVRLTLSSRSALVGLNGAGKTTLLKLLVGDLEVADGVGEARPSRTATPPCHCRLHRTLSRLILRNPSPVTLQPSLLKPPDLTFPYPALPASFPPPLSPSPLCLQVWKHHNLRLAYIAQHSMHHLEEHVESTPLAYIQDRFYLGRDKELSKLSTLHFSAEDEEDMNGGRGEIAEIIGRAEKGGKGSLWYEVRKVGRKDTDTSWEPLDYLKKMKPYVLKMVKNYDEKMKAMAAGVDIRPLTVEEVKAHLADFGINEDLAMGKIRRMSGGQKSRLVLAAAMWGKPHLIALDEVRRIIRSALRSHQSAWPSVQGAIRLSCSMRRVSFSCYHSCSQQGCWLPLKSVLTAVLVPLNPIHTRSRPTTSITTRSPRSQRRCRTSRAGSSVFPIMRCGHWRHSRDVACRAARPRPAQRLTRQQQYRLALNSQAFVAQLCSELWHVGEGVVRMENLKEAAKAAEKAALKAK